MLWVCSGDVDVTRRDLRLLASLLICVLIASTGGGYYSFFAMALLASVAVFLGIGHRSLAKPMTPLLLIAVILAVFLANITPSLVHHLRHGQGDAAQRIPAESELYGLKITQLLIPADDHRVRALADLKTTYNLTPLSTENTDASLGVIGSAGFLFLIGWLLYRRGRDESGHPARLFGHLSLLNASAVLIGTVGGFGSLFAHLVSPHIRAYNRISVYIAFFSLFAIALLLDSATGRFARTGPRRVVFHAVLLVLVVGGVLDQTNGRQGPDYDALKAEYRNDHDFVLRIEAALPRRAMVFQLPVQSFPEGESYDHLRAYLHSDTLRWSFGAMQGRDGGDWLEAVSGMPVAEQLETVALAGFSGLYVDRRLYPDGGARVESEVSSLLRAGPLVSRNERLSFFTLIDYRKSLAGDVEKALHPLLLKWRDGFSQLEGSPGDSWRWCSTTGELRIDNRLPRERRVLVEMTASSIDERHLRIEGLAFSDTMRVNPAAARFSKRFTAPPGVSSIRFTSDTPGVKRPPDPRLLAFRIGNFTLTEVRP
jgi:phosphoglycerol transferase